jgi:hypothetical protein
MLTSNTQSSDVNTLLLVYVNTLCEQDMDRQEIDIRFVQKLIPPCDLPKEKVS